MSSWRTAFQLIRVEEWVKNLFVLVPAFFAGEASKIVMSPKLLMTFIAFCCGASLVYVLNDWRDAARDRLHPTKKNRPFAARKVTQTTLVAVLSCLFVGLMLTANQNSGWPYVLVYLALNIAYTFGLKNISILDIGIISTGFLIRVLAGGASENIEISKWLLLLTFLLSMTLALGKRRTELLVAEESGEKGIRPALSGYNLEFVNLATGIICTSTLVCYLMYSISQPVAEKFGSDHVFVTSIFVLFGMLRYIQIIFVFERNWSPTEVLLKDLFTQVNLICWCITFFFIIYI